MLRTTCPRDCYDSCGIVAIERPGRPALIRGDPAHPVSRGTLCAKCSAAYNGVFQDSSERLTTPLRRHGPKGARAFVPITWNEANAEIAAKLRPLVESDQGRLVLNTHYTGTFAVIGYHFPLRFFNRLGATEVDPDTICNKAGHTALELLYGTSLDGFDPRQSINAASILVWGANPAHSAPHQASHWLANSPGPVIVVDPVRTKTAAVADLHLTPRPGTDAALAFALIHVLERDGRADRRFLAQHCVGGDELLRMAQRWTPDRGEQTTGVAAADIEQAARWFGSGPSLLWIGQGLQRQLSGGNVVRAVATLPAVTGAIGRPGGGFLYLNGMEGRGVDGDYLTAAHLGVDGPQALSHMDLAPALEDPAQSRVLFCWNINIAASNPEQARLKTALAREDLFTVVVDLFMTDTAACADVVLPAASFLEHDDLVLSYFHQSVSAQRAILSPPGVARPNSTIFRGLAAAMGWHDPELHEPDEEIIATVLERSGVGADFEQLCQVGTIWPAPEPTLQFGDLRFPTPSGRIEIRSEAATLAGLPDLPQPFADPPPTAGRLRLLSPASETSLNSLYGNERKLDARTGPIRVALHPAEAASRGLDAGEVVEVRSQAGSLRLALALDDAVPPGVALIPKGRWPSRQPGGANVNAITEARSTDMGHSSAIYGTEVTVTAVSRAAVTHPAAGG
jgi:anaerobic selenocysteine-containing dehydrogenase